MPSVARARSGFVLAAVAPLVVVLTAAPALASASVGVSVPPDPIVAAPGDAVDLRLRVTNPGAEPVVVRVEQRALEVGDDGRILILDHPDPAWTSMQLPPQPVEIAAGGYRDLVIPARVPDLGPDTYLIGFLVSPVVTAPGVRVINAVGAYLTLDVPGPRDRQLELALHAPQLVWGSSVTAELEVRSAGASAVRFWGESPAGRIDSVLLPAGRTRTIALPLRAPLGLGVVRADARVSFNHTDAEVVERVVSRRVVFVHPAYVAAGLLVVLAAVLATAGLPRRGRVRGAHRQPGPPHWSTPSPRPTSG